MIKKKKSLKMVSWRDVPADNKDKELKFFTIDGECVKCGAEPTSLVWYDFMENRRQKSQSIFRTYCLACGNKDMYMSKDVSRIIDGDNQIPPPAEEA